MSDIRTPAASERLSNAEVDADAALLRFAVDQQAFDRVELVADVEARRPDGRLVAEARTNGVAQIAEVEVLASRQTLPKSKNATAPNFPFSGTRTSADPSSIDSPPIGKPSDNGLTSKRPHPRMLDEPPRKKRR